MNCILRKGDDSNMVTISARVDESLKGNAEDIAKDIGVSLSTAITVFLKRFAAALFVLIFGMIISSFIVLPLWISFRAYRFLTFLS